MIIEYRQYHVAPGQQKALNEFMAGSTLPVFKKVGVEPLGFWQTTFGTMNRLHYLVPYEDYADRAEKWGAWLNHDERRPGVDADGSPLVEHFVNEIWEPVDYEGPDGWSGSDPSPADGAPRIFEFHSHAVRRDMQGYHKAWRDALKLMHKHGIHPVGFWLTTVGHFPTLNYILPFKDFATREERFAGYSSDPAKRSGIADDGGPFTHHAQIEIWTPTAYSALR